MEVLKKKTCAICHRDYRFMGVKTDDGNCICVDCNGSLQGKNYDFNVKNKSINEVLEFIEFKHQKQSVQNDFKADLKIMKKLYVDRTKRAFKIKHDQEIFFAKEIEYIIYDLYVQDGKVFGVILLSMDNPSHYTLKIKVKFSGDGILKKTMAKNALKEIDELVIALGIENVPVSDAKTLIKSIKDQERKEKIKRLIEKVKRS